MLRKVQHGVPALFLFFEGLDRILTRAGDWNRWLGTAEAFAGLLVLGAIGRAIGRLRWGAGSTPPRQHIKLHHVDWIDIGLATLLFVEVAAHRAETGEWRRPTLLLAVVTLAVGVLHGRITASAAKRQVLKVTDAGVSVGGWFFRRFTAAWTDIDRIDIAEKTAAIVRRDGRTHTFDLIDIRHSNDVTRALTRARTRFEVAGHAPAGVAGPFQT